MSLPPTPTPTPSPNTSIQEQPMLWTLAAIQWIHIVDFMILMPLGPQLLTHLNIQSTQFALLVSVYTFAAGGSSLLAATYVDRFERRSLLIGLFVLFALATMACGMVHEFHALLICRLLAGLFGGVLSSLVQTMVADTIPYERRGQAMGLVMSAFSLASVAGVPAGLWLANWGGWGMPFWVLGGLALIIAALARQTLPRIEHHLVPHQKQAFWHQIKQVLQERNHWRAFALSMLMMMAGFTVIPYITLYNTLNVGLTQEQIPYIYLLGGAVTLVSAQWVGRLSDRFGKATMFRIAALGATLPMMLITLMPTGSPLGWVLVVSTTMFLLMNARMIPGMALITAAVAPAQRGTFMALNGAVQSAAMGLATLIGGRLMGHDAHGALTHYWMAGLVGVMASGAAVWLSFHVRLIGAQDLSRST